MSRATRIEFGGACYHVMARGVARMATFQDDEDRGQFLDAVGKQVERGVLVVHTWRRERGRRWSVPSIER